MAWKKPSQELAELHEKVMKPYFSEKRQMFGFQTFFVNGNMFTGIYEDGITLRFSQKDKEEILGKYDEIKPFIPLGRPMREYVLIPESFLSDSGFCDEWVKKSYDFAASLPAKKKK